MTTWMPEQSVRFGASVTGPAHREADLPNQDAWTAGQFRTADSTVVQYLTVCDGLGSRPRAREGARAATRAARLAIRHWGPAAQASPGQLVRLVELLWRLEVSAHDPQTCATTCLIAAVQTKGDCSRITVATLGDGLAAYSENGVVTTVGGRGDGYANQTVALGTPHHMDAWATRTWETATPFSLMLATDGVADDLRPAALPAFVDWLDGVGRHTPRARGPTLRRALERWPVPGHSDDKTIAVLQMQRNRGKE
ncbi:protein phosphatase 2C domain-containing protein [Deinococcus sp. AJ005]|uniref:protein phosphatase 2C domain-containing protein n=1 Tax=Deinococcus sp. AJ005 TaxID=2652443 RepID=UPI00125CCFC1|nr:protein phosphatase 2C domain-containing protein [Deinococcus sp. AJ005]QFP75007.1 protein phosphatase 2C domain-containing protein [Deinococcus sp. AJ005]